MKIFLSKYRFQLWLAFFGLLWIAFLDYVLQLQFQHIIYPDSVSYLEAAKNLYVFHRGHPHRPILMALISGFPYLLGSGDAGIFNWSFLVNVSCWLGTGLLLFGIMADFLNKRIAFLFSAGFFLCIGVAVNNFHFLAESLFVFFLALFLFFLKKFYARRDFLFLALAVSVLILSMLVKPATKFIAIIVVLYFAKTLISHYRKKAMLLVYAAILAVCVQFAGMKYQFGDFTLTYIDVVTYHNYLCSKAVCLENGTEYRQEHNPRADYLFSFDPHTEKKIAEDDLKKQLLTNGTNMAKAYFLNLFDNTAHGCNAIDDCKNVKEVSYFWAFKTTLWYLTKIQNRVLTVLGILLALFFGCKYFRKEPFFAITALIVLYIIGVSGISCSQGDRFHIVVFPFIILLMARFFHEGMTRRQKNQKESWF